MKDVQNESDTRNIPLERVGVRNVQYPIRVLDKVHKTQSTTASIDLFVDLPHNFKGTHMSRFIEILHSYHTDLTMQHFLDMLSDIRESLRAHTASGTVRFPYFIEKSAPVTGKKSFLRYEGSYSGSVTQTEREFFVEIACPIATVCPCSKAISDFGAHNQRGVVTVRLRYEHFFWLEDIIALIEDSASTPLFTLLKRKDEKAVTESAFLRPRFVEDVVREVYTKLQAANFSHFFIEAQTQESIHLHNAYACATCP